MLYHPIKKTKQQNRLIHKTLIHIYLIAIFAWIFNLKYLHIGI